MTLGRHTRRSAFLVMLLSPTLLTSAGAKPAGNDPWPAEALVEPKPLAELLNDSSHVRPVVIYVGFPSLYNGAHIRNSLQAGPASKPEGLDQLRQVVRLIPRTKELVIYCGCCPFDHCPNIRPAYSYLAKLGFKKVTVLHIPTNLHTDWVAPGFPTTKGPSL